MALTRDERTIACARLLRRTGKTYAEIRAALGIEVSDDRLKTWLRGIPRPPETRRSRALVELKRECRRLRLTGLSHGEIAAITGVSAGSLGLWLRDLRDAPAVHASARRRAEVGPRLAGKSRSHAAAARRSQRQEAAQRRLGAITERDVLVTGVALYWAEGTKAKPWRPTARQVVFTNSDHDVIRVFLAALDLLGVPREDRTYRLHIHEFADVDAHERWWAERLGLPRSAFLGATLKRHKPVTRRRNVGVDYHGCLVVRVRRSSGLYDEIEGLWRLLVGNPVAPP
ncbi:MAG: hypothetical protein QOC82_1710 [Frankiaceae bacterium]|jgi:PAS domain-containing protein|nr:hypothetical protein [Frankiaceae bacterium]